MNVYKNRPDFERFAVLVNSSNSPSAGLQIQFTPDGEPCRDWKLPRYRAFEAHEEGYPGSLPEGDFVGLGLADIGLSMTARAAVGDVFERYGELLPVQVGDDKQAVWVFHCLTVIDAMDVANSNTYGVTEQGRPSIINRFSFYPELVKDAMLFRLPWVGHRIFCTDAFKQLVTDRGLKDRGLDFVLQWSDEPENMAKIRDYDQRNDMSKVRAYVERNRISRKEPGATRE